MKRILAWVRKALSGWFKAKTGADDPDTPNPVDRVPAFAGGTFTDSDHGAGFTVRWNKDEWKQYPDGWVEGLFDWYRTQFDQFAAAGAGALLWNKGGRSCVNQIVTSATYRVASTFNGREIEEIEGNPASRKFIPTTNERGEQIAAPDKIEVHWEISGGFSADWSYTHSGDCLGNGGMYKITDNETGISEWACGIHQGKTAGHPNGETPAFVTWANDGNRYPTSIRFWYESALWPQLRIKGK